MTDEEMAKEWVKTKDIEAIACLKENIGWDDVCEQAFLAGLKAGKGEYSKIYMLGRKDERERPCSLCNNPISICVRCERRKHCEGSDTGAYVSVCEDFIYKDVKE